MKTILSLFDLTGNWSQPYKDAGYDVIRFDLQAGYDVYELNEGNCKNLQVHGMLIALPCTDFAVSGAKHFAAKDDDGRTAASVKLARHCLDLTKWLAPKWWCLENPVGRLNTLIPEFASFGPWYFQPWWYGDPYPKKTGLWGTFNRNLIRNEVSPDYVYSAGGFNSAAFAKLGGKSIETKNARSATPKGFASAYFNANP